MIFTIIRALLLVVPTLQFVLRVITIKSTKWTFWPEVALESRLRGN